MQPEAVGLIRGDNHIRTFCMVTVSLFTEVNGLLRMSHSLESRTIPACISLPFSGLDVQPPQDSSFEAAKASLKEQSIQVLHCASKNRQIPRSLDSPSCRPESM